MSVCSTFSDKRALEAIVSVLSEMTIKSASIPGAIQKKEKIFPQLWMKDDHSFH
jgi:hypothetical protein